VFCPVFPIAAIGRTVGVHAAVRKGFDDRRFGRDRRVSGLAGWMVGAHGR
jgi:hypothetical protein